MAPPSFDEFGRVLVDVFVVVELDDTGPRSSWEAFLLDTGSNECYLRPGFVRELLGLTAWRGLFEEAGQPQIGDAFAGPLEVVALNTLLVIEDDDGGAVVQMPCGIAHPDSDRGALPSLLGTSLLQRTEFLYAPPRGELHLRVLDADGRMARADLPPRRLSGR
jgi:hypothetical protein